MAGGGFATSSGGGTEFEAKITPIVIISCIMAATGGLMFGYDVGVSGGVTSMPDFLKKFFPVVYRRTQDEGLDSNYCKYDNQGLQLFTSSLYLAGLTATFFASYTTRRLGRRLTMLIAGFFFVVGVVLNAAAQDLAMLIIGRILLGCGVGFANQAVPLFLSEIAPINHRGAVNILFQLLVTVGILVANLINYGTSMMKHGWRVSLGLAAVPGFILFIGSLVITETPPSLVEMGKEMEGRAALQKIRGVDNVDAEFQQIVTGCEQAKQVKKPFKKLFKKSGFPALFISTIIQVFQQFTGINAIMFYAPVLFQTLGFKSDASLLSAVITGLVNVGATFVSIYAVDKVGRRKLLLQASIQMFISQVAIGAILVTHLKATGGLDRVLAAVVVVLVCTFVMSFAWSWGPMGWLIPSEIFPIETRTAGFAFAVSTNMIFTFIIAQAFLSMLCHMKAYIFFFFSAWILVMGLFVVFLLPETKGVPIELVEERVWKQHPVWKKFFEDERKETTD
ncbi:Sugar transport protein 13 [Sesamum alatum]|uniref:Sugar transport protein 13 n=1 Tax=Sesamum alatum TaxID=300844 RepID=A0AAE2CKN2_9LAMI|nr:Sugar transport protein 13 [Sesamum alatum]